MAVSNLVAASSGLTAARFPAAIGAPFIIPNGLTLRNTITSTSTISSLPSQIWVVLMGGGGSGGTGSSAGGGGGGGGACIGWIDVPSSGSLTFTIGAGGAAVGSNTTGNIGGRTSVGNVIAWGGGGGCSGGSTGNPWNDTPTFYGPGAGLGGATGWSMSSSVAYAFPWKMNAPFYVDINWNMDGTTPSYVTNISARTLANYTGGGSGGLASTGSYTSNKAGGDGLAGGGGYNNNATATSPGGNSTRDGGVTNTFTGGTAAVNNGGGGAGLLANGGTPTVNNAGTGGSGGGGGGGAVNVATSGAGGAGCVLIYY